MFFGVLSITQNCKNIEALSFISCSKIENKAVEAMLAVPRLKKLDFFHGGLVDDTPFANIACTNLTYLRVCFAKFTDVGIEFSFIFINL